MTDSTAPETGSQVKVIFTTTEVDLQLPESKRQLLVPAGMCWSLISLFELQKLTDAAL